MEETAGAETERREEMKVCDMCKKEIKSAPFMTGHFPYVTVAITESMISGMRIADLCEECQLRVYNFVNNKSDKLECQGNIGG
jgi:hypothetical protein